MAVRPWPAGLAARVAGARGKAPRYSVRRIRARHEQAMCDRAAITTTQTRDRAPQNSISCSSIKAAKQANVAPHFAKTPTPPKQYQCLTSVTSVSLFKSGKDWRMFCAKRRTSSAVLVSSRTKRCTKNSTTSGDASSPRGAHSTPSQTRLASSVRDVANSAAARRPCRR